MNKSESITDLATALCLAQGEIGGAVKNNTNPHFKSAFADLESVIKVIKPAFLKHGLSFVQLPITSEGGKGIGVSTMLMHSSGQWIEGEYLLPLEKVTPQGAGAAITYARRYGLVSLVGIPQVDLDAEDISVQAPVVVEPPAKRVSKSLAQAVVALVVSSQASGETSELVEALAELDEVEKQVIWRQLTGKQQEFVRLTKEM
tara:strand:+ start:1087 stop:1692 length:606 start_codon:yes stop_codon:yes gene_type:complete